MSLPGPEAMHFSFYNNKKRKKNYTIHTLGVDNGDNNIISLTNPAVARRGDHVAGFSCVDAFGPFSVGRDISFVTLSKSSHKLSL